MHEPLVQIQNVSKLFVPGQPPALTEISAEVHRGQIMGLVGPDAAGKTTLMRLMAGLLKPTQGSISVAGFDTIKDAETVHSITGYMPQRFGLYEDLTVMQNLNLYADLRGVTGAERSGFQASSKFYKFSAFYRSFIRSAFRRHETKAWFSVRPH